ncbi:nickel pincer cofactor biosynthesis protein LarC [Victivallis sp. Marseille-Q1083]|uniref:nickel pincer cofactor biosynthesis protein LarC n=1 Tax=Victivallis sp. Marseille-Q1083 TaxID=2717288 RepID=UPI00158A31FA|nr:nickel pincer cofactor biosynthesis protein LarC [Victivallis sp. Marseille-Q1083]
MILYLECHSGISGDMTVAALLDLGADREKLDRALASLQLPGYSYTVSTVRRHGMRACDFTVSLADDHDHHHHHHHDPESRRHVHRNWRDIQAIIDRGALSPRANALAKKIFHIVAVAEAKAHGVTVDEVHFHEVGAIDSIVDIVAAAVCIDDLGIEETVVSTLTEGSGFVCCQHGELPVPVPAVAEIAAAYQLPLAITEVNGEMVTPTGAAIAAALRNRPARPENFTIRKIGLGAGKRDFGRPNLLRAMLLEATAPPAAGDDDGKWILETNLDDCSGEALGLAMEQLFTTGALDVHYLPVFMKKNRPGWLLRVIADAADLTALEAVIFRTTTTIGIRRYRVERSCLRRESRTVQLPGGEVAVKKCTFGNESFYYPEYESVKRLAEATGIAFPALYSEAQTEAARQDR